MGCKDLRGLAGQMLYWAGCTGFDNLAHYKGIPAPKKLFRAGNTDRTLSVKIHLEGGGQNDNQIRAYAPGSVTINAETYRSSLIVTPSSLVPDWGPDLIHNLDDRHVAG